MNDQPDCSIQLNWTTSPCVGLRPILNTSPGRSNTEYPAASSEVEDVRRPEVALAVHLADAVGRQVDQDARQVVGFLLEVVAAFGAGVLAEPRRARLESVARVRLRHLYSRRSEASEELRCAR